MDGIEIVLGGEDRVIRRAAVFEFVAVQGIRLVEDLHQRWHDYIVERACLRLSTAGLDAPIRFEGGFKQELCLLYCVVDGITVAEVSDVHAARGMHERT